MTETVQIFVKQWTRERAVLLAGICLTLGIVGGWSIRGWRQPANPATGAASSLSPATIAPSAASSVTAPSTSDVAQVRQLADSQAAALIEKLKSDGSNPSLLASIGNIYYDAQLYPNAIDYYARALQAKPGDAAVRTDMGTAYWYMGDADRAISEFNKALTYAPNNPNTLFNLGLVKWKGMKDGAGALADWEKLLAANPRYEGKGKLEEMMNEARSHSAIKP
ncbi:MAG TPA: tetratricopeptide repeat protein [Terracidiphilus sp.]|jgi:tetratricopeptide (TPR) repeat protein